VITLTPKQRFHVPVDAGNIRPDSFKAKTVEEINALPVWEGNRQRAVADLFHIEAEEAPSSDDVTIRVVGDLTKLKKIGAAMSFGRILVEGSVGLRLGEDMRGGIIIIKGNADSWVGTMMKAGRIEVMGNVGDYVGAAYRGSTEGMRGGTIVVHGDAGSEVGCFMRRGLIKVQGNIGSFTGMHMRDGTILVDGDAEGRLGAQMRGGKIIVLGHVPSILPTFNIKSIRKRAKAGSERISGPFYMFEGDLAENGEGRLYVDQAKNPQLRVYERYLVN
jgi:formylmethanofuran dehydrogenase subunit C